jgi:hypothetical protein
VASQSEHKRILRSWPSNAEDYLSIATSELPTHYDGPCVVVLDDTQEIQFPNYEQAQLAAKLAINLTIGGYFTAVVVAVSDAPNSIPKFTTANDWLFG